MNTAKFITIDELHYIKMLFSKDSRSVGVELSEQKIDEMIERLKIRLQAGTAYIAMSFDEDENPLCMYVGTTLPRIGGWFIGLTKVLESTNHFNKTAPIIAQALELLILKMESMGYFKFWMVAPEKHHNIRNKIIKKHSAAANRYVWYDEAIAPKGQLTGIDAFDVYRNICHWSDVLVRMFVLKQEHRIEILKQQNHADYKGTVIDI